MARSDERSSGKKRPAEGDPDGAQPLTKRFGYLQIGRPRCGVVAGVELTHSSTRTGNHLGARAIHDALPSPPTLPPDDAMMLDDTAHTTYVHNLDQELADPDPVKEHLVLHPLAARMIAVPNSILSDNPAQGKELVLYTEPTSLTVPKEQDSVRRAILESRARARAKRTQASSPPTQISLPVSSKSEATEDTTYEDDPMDID